MLLATLRLRNSSGPSRFSRFFRNLFALGGRKLIRSSSTAFLPPKPTKGDRRSILTINHGNFGCVTRRKANDNFCQLVNVFWSA